MNREEMFLLVDNLRYLMYGDNWDFDKRDGAAKFIDQYAIDARIREVKALNSLRQGHNHLSFASQGKITDYINHRIAELEKERGE